MLNLLNEFFYLFFSKHGKITELSLKTKESQV